MHKMSSIAPMAGCSSECPALPHRRGSQVWRGKRAPSAETTLYYGLRSGYTLGQIRFALVALLIHRGVPFFDEWHGWVLGFVAAVWLAICLNFIEYREPWIVVGIFAVLPLGTALTK